FEFNLLHLKRRKEAYDIVIDAKTMIFINILRKFSSIAKNEPIELSEVKSGQYSAHFSYLLRSFVAQEISHENYAIGKGIPRIIQYSQIFDPPNPDFKCLFDKTEHLKKR
ncbi:hypothetical protein P5673_013445, partial [Acropora cervicornis]